MIVLAQYKAALYYSSKSLLLWALLTLASKYANANLVWRGNCISADIVVLLFPGLFHRGVMMSGSGFSKSAFVADPVQNAVELADHLNCAIPR